jgi:uncharacterized membrane protein YoaK (UPF0700 family)
VAASNDQGIRSTIITSEAKLSWVLAGLAGLVGAAAFARTAGYFVTFMTGNTERAVVGYFTNQTGLAVASGFLILSFLGGVIVASWCRRHFWVTHPHAVTILTTICLGVATVLDFALTQWRDTEIELGPIMIVAFGIGALNTSFVRNGEVSIPLSYVTGTIVKLGQGIERHLSGGTAADWLGYFLLLGSFMVGALIGGCLNLLVGGPAMLATAAVMCLLTTAYTYYHFDRYGPLPE